MFLKIIFINFLLLCKVLNTKFCLSKFAASLMFHWKAIFILSLFYLCSLSLFHRDIESKPGPRNSKNHLPSFCHWNLNSLPAHNFAKMLILKAYNAICLSETYLDSSVPLDQVSLDWRAISWFAQTILIMLNEVEFVFTIRNLYQTG